MGNELVAIFDISWKLLLVLGLAVLATRGLRWLSTPAHGAPSPLKVVARLPIGPQQAIVLIAVGPRRLLIGQTPQQITLLGEVGADELADVDASGGPHVAQSGLPPTIPALQSLWARFQTDRIVRPVPGANTAGSPPGTTDGGTNRA